MYNCDFLEDAGLRGQFGPPVIPKGKNAIGINPRFFAAKMIKSHNLIVFENADWYEWHPDRWVPVRECILQSRIADLLQDELRAFFRSQQKAAQHSHRPVANFGGVTIGEAGPSAPAYDLISTRNIEEILCTMRYMCDRGENLPPLDPDVIPVQNGLLRFNAEIQDFEFRAYTQDDMIFYTLDVIYDSEAKSELFDKVLSEIMPDPDDRRVVQEYLGSAIFSENHTKKFMTFTGVSNSGKSMLLKVFTKIMTPKRIFDIDPKTLAGNYGLSPLTTQTLITVFEAGKDAFCNPFLIELFNKASGGDPFKTNRKNSNEQVEHVGLYSILFTSNYNQRFMYEGDGGEFANRLLPILFTKPIENPDLTLGESLIRDHRSAFFNWLLAGARYVRQKNWHIELSPAQIVRRDRIIQATHGIELFVQNYIEKFETGYIKTEDAFNRYISAGYDYEKRSTFDKKFAEVMGREFRNADCKNLPSGDGKNNARGYRGVRWKDVNELK